MDKLQFRLLLGGGITMVAGPMLGIGAHVVMMYTAFSKLGKEGIVSPQLLAERMGEVMLFSATGVVIGLVGFAALVTGFILWLNDPKRESRRRPREMM